MDIKCWTLLTNTEYTKVWDDFERKFNFKPSAETPAIDEPKGSLVFDISSYFQLDEDEQQLLEKDLNEKLLQCFKIIVKKDEFIYALDWQHPAYKLDVLNINIDEYNARYFIGNGLLFRRGDADYYMIEFFPNGDYHIFLTKDMKNGIIGHPWKQSMCVFGKELLVALSSNMPKLFIKTIRKN